MVAGRPFQREIASDNNVFIINEAAVKAFGWTSPEEAIDKTIRKWGRERINKIIGVTENFHYQGLQSKVAPLVMVIQPDRFWHVSLSIETQNLPETISFLRKKMQEFNPGRPLNYFFIDENFDLQYRSEERAGKIVCVFTVLGVLIACLGLYGLASIVTVQRTKEIAIRKILGASMSNLISLLSRQFLVLVVFANLIAWPFAYFALNKWLQNFAYRIDISVWTFVLSASAALLIAFFAVTVKSIKAALADPVVSLRYE